MIVRLQPFRLIATKLFDVKRPVHGVIVSSVGYVEKVKLAMAQYIIILKLYYLVAIFYSVYAEVTVRLKFVVPKSITVILDSSMVNVDALASKLK